ncbi:LysR family transcriptional regulator [Paramesorhizobium deserti]|uniref:LysR family transcriptional regulator n=1 Tax=Paramesorhizobium deserti TaxID=1494590 RepID=UPI0009E8DDC5|nr:LysR family transcriptional regulator [Paramesorhizobium deserti]
MTDLSLDLRYLRCALWVAEFGSFRGAAKALELPQSTVSRRMQLLKHRLGFALFGRSRSGAKLTNAGDDFLRGAAAAANHLDRAAQLAAAVDRGERDQLRLAFFASLSAGYLHRLLRTFRKRHPSFAQSSARQIASVPVPFGRQAVAIWRFG